MLLVGVHNSQKKDEPVADRNPVYQPYDSEAKIGRFHQGPHVGFNQRKYHEYPPGVKISCGLDAQNWGFMPRNHLGHLDCKQQ